jgi:hypothetical protein
MSHRKPERSALGCWRGNPCGLFVPKPNPYAVTGGKTAASLRVMSMHVR